MAELDQQAWDWVPPTFSSRSVTARTSILTDGGRYPLPVPMLRIGTLIDADFN